MTTLDPIHREEEHHTSDASPEYGDIARLAYHLWQQRGCPEGYPDED